MVLPFLAVDPEPPERFIRSGEIVAEVEAYVDFIATYVAPYVSLPREVVAQMGLPEPPPVPPCLEELERSEKWGFPNPGSWLDQPAAWLDDMEATQRGRWRSRQKQQQVVADSKRIFRDAPTGETL